MTNTTKRNLEEKNSPKKSLFGEKFILLFVEKGKKKRERKRRTKNAISDGCCAVVLAENLRLFANFSIQPMMYDCMIGSHVDNSESEYVVLLIYIICGLMMNL